MHKESQFIIEVAGVPVLVYHKPHWLNIGYDHFEFFHPENPRKGIPISETGYRSHFAPTHEVAECGSPEIHAEEFCNWFLNQQGGAQKINDSQLTLF